MDIFAVKPHQVPFYYSQRELKNDSLQNEAFVQILLQEIRGSCTIKLPIILLVLLGKNRMFIYNLQSRVAKTKDFYLN